MNKEVIYIEPEDDIIDVVNHIKATKEKVVALVPPKKPGILRSAINIKLISRTAKEQEKAVVLVTADPSLIKMAAMVKIPVAKTLQSRPSVPVLEEKELKEVKTNNIETITDDSEDEDTPSGKAVAEKASAKPKKKSADMNLNSVELEQGNEKKNSKKEGKVTKIPSLDKYKLPIIIGAVALVLVIIVVLFFAIGVSGAAEIIVKIRTNSSSFAENVSLVTDKNAANPADGKLFLEKVEYVKEASTEFTPTGEKDFGNKASGKLTVVKELSDEGSLSVPTGTEFYTGDLTFIATSDVSASWDGKVSTCENLSGRTCVIYVSVSVIASEGGTKYNIPKTDQSAWRSSLETVTVYNNDPFTGGTTDMAKVVTAEDISKAKEKLENTEDGKDELLDKIKDDMVAIDASFNKTTSDPTSSPAEGEKASDKATLTAKTTYSIYVVDKKSISEFIKASISGSIGSDQAIYDIGSPFFERFVENNGTYSAKLKTTVKTGPEVTEKTIIEKVKGKKTGEVQSLLQSINGISSVSVKTQFPWVHSISEDESQITVSLEVEE